MKTILIPNSHSTITHYRAISRTTSAFGIPEEFEKILKTKIIQHEGLRNYLFFLLNRYRPILYSGKFPTGNGVKTRYQEEGQNLIYFNFKPFNGDWIELRLVAFSYGVSMTQFFVYLLKLDSSELEKIFAQANGGKVPTTFLKRPIKLVVSLERLRGVKRLRIKFGKQKYEIDESDPEHYSMKWTEDE